MLKLVNPPQTESLDDKLDPPLGLMYIAAVLEEASYPIEIIDLPLVPHHKWREVIGKADIVGITVLSASLYQAKEILHLAKLNNPEVVVVVGGSHPTSLPYETLREGFDIVVVGEGEYTFLNLVQNYYNGEPLERVIVTPDLLNVDSLPFPARHLVNLKAYTRKVAGKTGTSLIASRGCPYHCAFCDKSVHGDKIRFRAVESVVEEIKLIIKEYNIQNFIFYDDTFTINKKRLYKLLDELKKLNVHFRCNGNARVDTYEDFVKLYEAGCREICFGIESGSQHVLNLINKQVTVEQNRQAIINAKKAGLFVKAFLMVGNPGESWKTINETVAFMHETKPHLWTVFSFVPLPGCDIHKNPSKYGIKILVRDWKEYFCVAGQNIGGLTHETEDMTVEELAKAREFLLKNLPPQHGPIPDYYQRLKQKVEA